MTRTISALVAQFPIGLDLRANHAAILEAIGPAAPQTLVVLPEGALSGYAEDPAFLAEIDPAALEDALRSLRAEAARRQLHLVFGSCLREGGAWFNAGIYAGPRHELFIYRKVNLAISERGAFQPGAELAGPLLEIAGQRVRLGIQICREIRFPEQWQLLAGDPRVGGGAQIFAYLTNAVGDAGQAPVWRSHLVSRAAENQRYVLAANAAAPAQKCPSMIITPAGAVPWETLSADPAGGQATLDLDAVGDWYLSQSRRDLCG